MVDGSNHRVSDPTVGGIVAAADGAPALASLHNGSIPACTPRERGARFDIARSDDRLALSSMFLAPLARPTGGRAAPARGGPRR